jgi:DivIVA domain-containing protein
MRPGDIEGQRFTFGKRGYDPEEVHTFLRAVADQVGRLQGENDWQRARVEHLEQRNLSAQDSAYERISREFMEVVRRADEAAGQVRARAENEARAAMGGAREDANRIVAQAAQEADRILQTARTEAERLVAEATDQVERLVRRAGTGSASRGFDLEDSMRRHPAWRESERDLQRVDARHARNGHTASSDYFGAASGQVAVPPSPMVAAPEPFDEGSTPEAARTPQRLPDPVFTDFEDFDLNFDGSLFDLLDEAGA